MNHMKVTDWIACAALLVSVVSGTFSFFQWRASESETDARITASASIEISKKYFEDKETPLMLAKYFKNPSELSTGDTNRLLIQLNYIAGLANKGSLDRKYLSPQIACDIRDAYNRYEARAEQAASDEHNDFVVIEIEDMMEFAQHDQFCLRQQEQKNP